MNKKQTKYLQVSILLRNFAAKHKADRGQVSDITKVTKDWSVTLETKLRVTIQKDIPFRISSTGRGEEAKLFAT